MFIIGSMVLGIFLFVGLVLVTLLLGAAARSSEKEILMRTKAERMAGLTGDFDTDTPHPIHDRYLDHRYGEA